MSIADVYEKEMSFQTDRRKATVEFIKIASDLWYDNSVELVLFRNQLIDRSVSDILNLHKYANDFAEKPISIFNSVEIAQAIQSLDLPPSKLDIGKLTYEYFLEQKNYEDALSFAKDKLSKANDTEDLIPKDIVLYGFGRIGRLLARELMSKAGKGSQMRLRAIVTRGNVDATVLEKRASLLKMDSVHGDFNGTVSIDEKNKALIINGTTVYIISANAPEDIDYTIYGINNALVIDNTGAFRDDVALSRHLKGKGVIKILLTAPGKGIPNIVHGVNHLDHDPNIVDIFSAASCTTNAITPILKAVEETFGVDHGHLETIHAYTNDQNLVDNMHSKYRRGRAAALNMVITETGAAKAVSKVLPEFEGKLTGNAIRVPTPNVSMAILNLVLENETTADELNEYMRSVAMHSDLRKQIDYSNTPEAVSTDFVGTRCASIYDAEATIVNGKQAICYLWYDNEFGYSCQVHRVLEQVAGVKYAVYPKA
jgi:glyceraldehyde 3-phosphate dehydrogenase